jgi:enamine deaminase RidA (YjgF/YER057c/UK114 family)
LKFIRASPKSENNILKISKNRELKFWKTYIIVEYYSNLEIFYEVIDVERIDRKLSDLGITLPNPPKPSGVYVTATNVGNLIYTSGTGCKVNGEVLYQGKVGKEISIEEGQMAARLAAMNLLSILRENLGSLDRINKIVKILGFVNCTDEFTEQPKVMNNASELFEESIRRTGQT